ncbi:MAG: DUF1173 family protein [Nevskiaceae bacterium]|nr:MAG: DUF1173 family protein [Nevskiaceae bacterium]
MSKTLIDVGRYIVPLASIRGSVKDRAHHLRLVYSQGATVRCLCVGQGIEMGVARRSDDPPIYYLYHLHRTDPSLHGPACPHFIAQSVGGIEGTSRHLDHPPDATPQASSYDYSLEALLDDLVVEAGLNEWRSAWRNKRTFFRFRTRLLEASLRVAVPGTQGLLADSVYCPPIWDPAQREAIDDEWSLFIATLNASTDANQRGYVLGVVKSFEVRSEWTAPRLLLNHHHTPFWLGDVPSLLPFPPDAGQAWLVLLELVASRSKHGYRVKDGAALLFSAHWIPVHSTSHGRLADQMVDQGVSFTAPLAHDANTAWALPDFLYTSGDGVTWRRGPFGSARVSRPSQT